MPYPQSLSSRAVIKPGRYALIPPQGLVLNVVPGFFGCELSIVCSPKLGASFVEYLGLMQPGGKTSSSFGQETDIEVFFYLLEGSGSVRVESGGHSEVLEAGGFAYAAPGAGLSLYHNSGEAMRFILYKQRYIPHPDATCRPYSVFGSIHEIAERPYAGLPGVFVRDLLPADEAFDMNFHTLSFAPGACHPFVETHVQEHGAYLYEGQGMYLLGEQWYPVQAGDFIWFGPFTQQGCYGTGEGRLSYIYSKDCNRDVGL